MKICLCSIFMSGSQTIELVPFTCFFDPPRLFNVQSLQASDRISFGLVVVAFLSLLGCCSDGDYQTGGQTAKEIRGSKMPLTIITKRSSNPLQQKL